MLGGAQSDAVAVDGNPDEDRGNERAEVGSDAAEGESKVHALGEEGVDPAGYSAIEVRLQHSQELTHLRRWKGRDVRESRDSK